MALQFKTFSLLTVAILWTVAALVGCAQKPAPSPPAPTASAPPQSPRAPSGSVDRRSIAWLDSLEKAQEKAKKEKKPLLIDFWGPG